MSILGIIIVVLICLVLVIALFFEIKGLIKSIKQYKSKKNISSTTRGNKDKPSNKEE